MKWEHAVAVVGWEEANQQQNTAAGFHMAACPKTNLC